MLPARRAPRYREAAYAAIKEAILSGEIAAGEPLVEERIAAALGISRTPVREALAILEHEGLIAPRGRGLFIRELTREEFLDMFVANEVVEPYLARRAALHATEADISAMQAAIDHGRAAAQAVDLYASLASGREFHRCLGRAAGNARLAHFVLRNEEQTDLFLLSLSDPGLLSADHMEASNREHQEILDAIRHRDPEAASRLVIYHTQALRARHAPLFRSVGTSHVFSGDAENSASVSGPRVRPVSW
jgi:DNA-binding GntR family transcriptional regulator